MASGGNNQDRRALAADGVSDGAAPTSTRPVGGEDGLAALRRMLESIERLRSAADAEWAALLEAPESAAAAGGSDVGDLGGASTGGVPPSAGEQAALHQRLQRALEQLEDGLVERSTEVRLLLLAVMAGEHLLLLGPPGTAKSALARRLGTLVCGNYFERLLTRFSVPEELFGPLSMCALEEDKYVRQTCGYLPSADVAFLDEIFKANSSILNTLLTIINERVFDNGDERVQVPLLTLVGASNELPESGELDALYDRFLLRVRVSQVSDVGATVMLMQRAGPPPRTDGRASHEQGHAGGGGDGIGSLGSNARSGRSGGLQSEGSSTSGGPGRADGKCDGTTLRPSGVRISRADVQCACDHATSVHVSPSVIELLLDMRTYLQERMEPAVYVSDRRMLRAQRLLQVAAFCDGRVKVERYDVLLLQHCLCHDPKAAARISDWVLTRLADDRPNEPAADTLAALFVRACHIGAEEEPRGARCSVGEAASGTAALAAQLADLREALLRRRAAADAELSRGLSVLRRCMWLAPDDAAAAAAVLGPRLRRASGDAGALLRDVVALQHAVAGGACDAGRLSLLLPHRWAHFVRHGDLADVSRLGTRPL